MLLSNLVEVSLRAGEPRYHLVAHAKRAIVPVAWCDRANGQMRPLRKLLLNKLFHQGSGNFHSRRFI